MRLRSAISICLALPCVAAIATGCATQGQEGAATVGRSMSADCIINRSIRNYTVLDDSNLIIYGPGSVPHHVVLVTPSLDISREFTIGILDRDLDGRICPYGGDAILIDGVVRERIPIRSIERINDQQVELLKTESGLTEAQDQVIVTPIE